MANALQRPGDLRLDRHGDAIFSLAPAARAAGESFQSRIWRVGPDQTPQILTQGPGCDTGPAPSPVDDRIAFLSDRDQTGQFLPYMIAEGQVTGPLCVPAGTVEKLVWARDGGALFLLVADKGLDCSSSEGALPLSWGAQVDDPLVVDGQPMRRLLRLDLQSRETLEIQLPRLSVWDFDVGPSEEIVAIVSSDPTERGWHAAHLILLSATGCTTIFTPTEPLQCPSISPSGSMALVLEGPASDRNLVAGTLRLVDLSTGAIRPLAADRIDDLTHAAWLSDTVIGFSGWLGFGCRYGRVATDGQVLSDYADKAQLGPGRFAARVEQGTDHDITIRESTDIPPEVVLRKGEGWRSLSAFNKTAGDGGQSHRTTELDWPAPDGKMISGLLLEPEDSPPGPLIVLVHGGPTASARCMFDPGGARQYVDAGYRVLLPNYRGSVGRGQDFTRAVMGDPAGGDFADILSGIDHVVALGLADPNRIGITGSSYGGYLAAWAAAATGRFAAAMVVAGISDLLSCNYDANHAFSEWVARGPVSDPAVRDLLLARSPIYNLDPATTPTLFLHGERDRCTPVTQAQMMYRALQRRGTRARLVTFPREGHMIEETGHRARLRREALDWFAEHLEAPA